MFIAGQYYETMVRYEKFFILETQYIPGVLVSVVSDLSADATDTGSTTVQYVILAHTWVCCLSSQTKHISNNFLLTVHLCCLHLKVA